MIFEEKFEGGKGVSYMGNCGYNCLDRGDSLCKGFEVCLRNSSKIKVVLLEEKVE